MSREMATTKEVYSKLQKSEFRCALTGWELQPDNFALDHIVPMSSGGGDDIDNLDCVHPVANRAKGTMSKEDFIEMCIAVATHQASCTHTPPG